MFIPDSRVILLAILKNGVAQGVTSHPHDTTMYAPKKSILSGDFDKTNQNLNSFYRLINPFFQVSTQKIYPSP